MQKLAPLLPLWVLVATFGCSTTTKVYVTSFPTGARILIDGEEAQNVGGHLDLSRPILPEMSMVESR